MKTIESHPGAGVFRSTIVIVLILACMGSFFIFTENLTKKAEEVAKRQVLVHINQALAMMLYDFAIKDQLMELVQFDRENPFVVLSIYLGLPGNYHGAILNQSAVKEAGWYFDLNSREAIYQFSEGAVNQRFVMVFEFKDNDGDGEYSSGDLGQLVLKKV